MMRKVFFLIPLVVIAWSCAAKKDAVASKNVERVEQIEMVPNEQPIATAVPQPNSGILDGKAIYEERCAKCHQLYKPTDFSNEQWKVVLVSMQENANLNDMEINAVYEYLASVAK